jgi:hypothetical protein
VTLRMEDLEILPPIQGKMPLLKTNMSLSELEELKMRFHEVEALTMEGRLTEQHMMRSQWIIRRDLGQPKDCYFVPPQIRSGICYGDGRA